MGEDAEREGEGNIDFSPVEDAAGVCVSWPALLTLEAVDRVISNPPLVLHLFR